jgi:hypothetical protein
MTDEERARIKAEARATVKRLANWQPGKALPEHEPPVRRLELDTLERREWRLPEPEPPPREPMLDTRQDVDWSQWSAWVDARIAAAIEQAFAAEREEGSFTDAVIQALKNEITEALSDELERTEKTFIRELHEFRIQTAKLESALGVVREFLAGDRAKAILDLPNPLAKTVN